MIGRICLYTFILVTFGWFNKAGGLNPISLVWIPQTGTWAQTSAFDVSLQPKLMVSGLWFPSPQQTDWPDIIGAFELLDRNQPQPTAGRWEAIREAASDSYAIVGPSNLTQAAMGQSPTSQSIAIWSRFYAFGSETGCPGGMGRPCFTYFEHHRDASPSAGSSSTSSSVPTDKTFVGGKAYVGWPAHYSCPDGYMWIGPSNTVASGTPTGLGEQVSLPYILTLPTNTSNPSF